jgi:hypothetical protein
MSSALIASEPRSLISQSAATRMVRVQNDADAQLIA